MGVLRPISARVAGGGPAAAAAAQPVVAAISAGVLSGVVGGISAWGGALSVASTGIAKRAAETTKPFQDAGSDFALGVEIMRQTTQRATPEINNSVKAYQSTETSAREAAKAVDETASAFGRLINGLKSMLSSDGGTSGDSHGSTVESAFGLIEEI